VSDNRPIGIFDSGAGGLTVFKEIAKALPNEDIVYLGDTARVPYGNKSKETVIKYSIENTLFLLKKNVKIIVIACNTASSLAGNELRCFFNVEFLDVVNAGVDEIERLGKKRIGVIGTKATIASRIYQQKLRRRVKGARIIAKACPLFVPMVEAGIIRGKLAQCIVDEVLADFKNVDALLLGCTHYPMLKALIKKSIKNAQIVSSSAAVAKNLKIIMKEKGLLTKRTSIGRRDAYISDALDDFAPLARLFLKDAMAVNIRKTEL